MFPRSFGSVPAPAAFPQVTYSSWVLLLRLFPPRVYIHNQPVSPSANENSTSAKTAVCGVSLNGEKQAEAPRNRHRTNGKKLLFETETLSHTHRHGRWKRLFVAHLQVDEKPHFASDKEMWIKIVMYFICFLPLSLYRMSIEGSGSSGKTKLLCNLNKKNSFTVKHTETNSQQMTLK